MKAADISLLLGQLGCARISYGTGWVRSTCPLAQWRHAGGRDKSPSFAVSITPDGMSHANCLACGYKGILMSMLWYMDGCGYNVDRLVHFVAKREQPDLSDLDEVTPVRRKLRAATYWGEPPNLSKYKAPLEPPKPLLRMEEHQLLQYIPVPSRILAYLLDTRKLSRSAVEYWELGYSRRTDRVMVPIRAHDGGLVALSGRAMGEQEPKYKHSKGFKRDLVLYGEDKVKRGGVGYLHEGFFACIYAWQFGYENCVARMGTHLSGYQEDRLVEWFDRLVIVPDGDKPGLDSAAEIYERLQSRIPTTVADMPFGSEVDRLSKNDLIKVMGLPETLVDTEAFAN